MLGLKFPTTKPALVREHREVWESDRAWDIEQTLQKIFWTKFGAGPNFERFTAVWTSDFVRRWQPMFPTFSSLITGEKSLSESEWSELKLLQRQENAHRNKVYKFKLYYSRKCRVLRSSKISNFKAAWRHQAWADMEMKYPHVGISNFADVEISSPVL